jgi:hypothetical protein
MVLLDDGGEKLKEVVNGEGLRVVKVVRRGSRRRWRSWNPCRGAGTWGLGKMLRRRIRHFTDGTAIGSRAFVNSCGWDSSRSGFARRR